VNASLLIRFGLSALVGGGVAIGTAAVTTPPPIVSTAHHGQPITLTGQNGDQLEFGLQPGNPTPLDPLPATTTIQLTSFHSAAASFTPGGNTRAPWWNASVPRVPAISQFDGGPLQSVNCLMASGAMLARLAFGIVTTGSQLRALQDDQEGGTNFGNLDQALERGWCVHFFKGAVTPLQFRALLYAGAGAVVSVVYGEVPVGIRLQTSFTGNHAIYIDAFRPAGADGPAAYYVMDPIGRTWQGYKGGWWPADAVEHAATVFGGGLISTTWAFAGGVVPANHPILPPSAYPSATPSSSQRPSASPSASAVTVVSDPMPAGSTPLGTDTPTGDPPPIVPKFPPIEIVTGLFQVEPEPLACVGQPPPSGCPTGIVGVIDLSGVTTVRASASPGGIKLLYANPIAPGTYQIIFESPPGAESALWVWGAESGGSLSEAAVESGVLDGTDVSIATVTLDPTADFSFVATASGDGIREISPVGSLDVNP
jgi:hypothetical protein